METVYLDAHIVVWLFYGEIQKFSDKVKEIMNNSDLVISPIILFELQYLLESKKISHEYSKIMKYLSRNIGLKVSDNKFITIIENAIKINFTRDPFDRIIVAEAMEEDAKLVTKDSQILKFYKKAVW